MYNRNDDSKQVVLILNHRVIGSGRHHVRIRVTRLPIIAVTHKCGRLEIDVWRIESYQYTIHIL